jgi:hypothetical protein
VCGQTLLTALANSSNGRLASAAKRHRKHRIRPLKATCRNLTEAVRFLPFVYVPGCSGLSADTRKRMADRLTAWGLSFNQCWMKSRVTAMARSGASGIAGNQGTVRTERAAETVPQRCRGEPVSPYS